MRHACAGAIAPHALVKEVESRAPHKNPIKVDGAARGLPSGVGAPSIASQQDAELTEKRDSCHAGCEAFEKRSNMEFCMKELLYGLLPFLYPTFWTLLFISLFGHRNCDGYKGYSRPCIRVVRYLCALCVGVGNYTPESAPHTSIHSLLCAARRSRSPCGRLAAPAACKR
ncbi:Protein of unknown function [Gryllus bimaculatus]|nr:Protein of unknown function [Gryllus bimaculatus]